MGAIIVKIGEYPIYAGQFNPGRPEFTHSNSIRD